MDETLPTQTNPTKLNQRIFYIVLAAFHLVAFFWVMDMPFLGDSIPSNLYAADNIYDNNFTTVFNIPTADPGHPTLYPFILALFWSIAGKSLWVTHLLQVAVGFLLCSVVYKVAQKYLSQKTAQFAALIFAISSLYVAQLTNVSLQLPLTLVAFAAFYFWQQGKRIPYMLMLCAMVLVHLQGAFLLLFLAANDAVFFAFEKGFKSVLKWAAKNWWVYTLPFLVLVGWAVAHQNQFGWAISSPNYLRETPTLKGIAYNFAIAFWRIIDFGYLLPLAAVLLYLLKNRKKLYPTDSFIKLLISYSLLLLLVGGGICILFAYPPIHRYFLPSTVVLILLFAAALQNMRPLNKKIWAVVASVVLVAGNFMYYPGKCIGDANIAYAPIYNLEQQIANDFDDSITFYTYAPLSYPSAIRYLDSTKGLRLKGLYNTSIDSVAFVLQSNMNCEFSFNGLEQLKGWHGTSYEQGGVYITIYANPAYIAAKPKGWQTRQPSSAEIWLLNLKQKLN